MNRYAGGGALQGARVEGRPGAPGPSPAGPPPGAPAPRRCAGAGPGGQAPAGPRVAQPPRTAPETKAGGGFGVGSAPAGRPACTPPAREDHGRAHGPVTWVNDHQGVGVITPEEGGDRFVHDAAIAEAGFLNPFLISSPPPSTLSLPFFLLLIVCKQLIYNVFPRYQKEDAMFHTAMLIAHRGATIVNRDELARYEPPEAEGRWRPVKHSLIVDLMHEELARREMQITQEEYAIQREGNYLFAALTTNWLDTGETAAALAFRHSNDKTAAMKMYADVHVFICDSATRSISKNPAGHDRGAWDDRLRSSACPTGCGLQPTPSPPVRRRRRHPHRGD
jgi:hypothetical protein